MGCVPVGGKEIARYIVVRTESTNRCSVFGRDCPVLCTTLAARWRDPRHFQVVNHPAFVPARLVVDNEQSRDVRKQVNGSAHIVGISWQARLWLKCDSN